MREEQYEILQCLPVSGPGLVAVFKQDDGSELIEHVVAWALLKDFDSFESVRNQPPNLPFMAAMVPDHDYGTASPAFLCSNFVELREVSKCSKGCKKP